MTFLHVEITSKQEHTKISLTTGVKKTSANLAGLLALPCRIGEFSCVPPHKEEEKALDPHKFSTTGTKLLSTIFAKWSNIYIYIIIYIRIYTHTICVRSTFKMCSKISRESEP